MKNTYKELFNEFKPSKQLLDSAFEMQSKKINKRFVSKIACGVLALAVLIGGTGFGIQYNTKQEILNNPIGNVMLVNASEAIGQSSTSIGYKLYVKDITGLSEKEIYDLKIETASKELKLAVDTELERKNIENNTFKIYGNAMIATDRGMSDFVLKNIKNPEDVDKITVSNTSDYIDLIMSVNDDYFTEPEEDVFVFDNRNIDLKRTTIQGHNVSVDGERYAKCREIESSKTKKYGYDNYYNKDSEFYMMELDGTTGLGKEFYITYMFTDELYNALGKNPDMDLTTVKDTVTVKVDFKNGYTATTVIETNLNKNGKVFARCTSYDYSK